MKRPKPPRELTSGFHEAAMRRARMIRRSCFLEPYDDQERDCGGRYEAMHLLPAQEVRNSPALYGLEREFVELIECDPRNAALGCEAHHRRFDRHLTPSLILPHSALPDDTLEFVDDYGLEGIAKRRFSLP